MDNHRLTYRVLYIAYPVCNANACADLAEPVRQLRRPLLSLCELDKCQRPWARGWVDEGFQNDSWWGNRKQTAAFFDDVLQLVIDRPSQRAADAAGRQEDED